MNSVSWLILMGYLILNNFNERQLLTNEWEITDFCVCLFCENYYIDNY